MTGRAFAHALAEVRSPLALLDVFAGFAHEPHAFLLDSAMDPSKLGRYSFAGHRPFLVLSSKGDRVTVTRGPHVETRTGDALEVLRSLLAEHRVPAALYEDSAVPFLAGAVGYLGYELCHGVERLPRSGRDDLGLPDCHLAFVDGIYAYDHLEGRMFLSAIGRADDEVTARARADARLEALRAELAAIERAPRSAGSYRASPLVAMQPQAAYEAVVTTAREHILRGDVFEVCTSHRLACDFEGDAFALYRRLRALNPAPFASYLNLPDVTIVSASPERFLRLDRDGRCEARPIKGTRPRGATVAEDDALREALRTSEKDRAENVMIVDLVRNDLGRVCAIGSVEVSELVIVEAYATVFQLVSTVIGHLEPGKDCVDLLRAAFPGGSMTGAPKIEAMRIIDALEPVQRGIYSGAIGYFDLAGNVDLDIVIRTILVTGGKAYVQVGGAVVSDSIPSDEHAETIVKARAMVRALEGGA